MKFQKFLLTACTTTLISSGGMAFANKELVFLPYVELGIIDYSLEFDGTIPIPLLGNADQRVENQFFFDMSTIKGGLVVAYGDLFVNSFYRGTSEDSDLQILPSGISIKWSGKREDMSISVGYKILDAVTIFAGYRESETKGSGTGNSNYSFEQDGFFLGASYYLGLTDTGGLNFSFGNAWLDSELKEDVFNIAFPDASGDGAGIKFGVAWRDSINENWSYTISAEHFRYDHDMEVGDTGSVDVDEIETSYSAGLIYNW